MQLKSVVFLAALTFTLSLLRPGEGLFRSLDRGMTEIESIYNKLEEKVESSYIHLKQKINAMMLKLLETVDSRVSQALVTIRGVTENCRVPAEVSLGEISRKFREDFNECTATKINEKFDSLYDRSQTLSGQLRRSYNTSVTLVKSCVASQVDAVSELRFGDAVSCQFPVGLVVTEKFLEDAASVQSFGVDVLRFSYDSTLITGSCFKSELVDSSIQSVVQQAEKCHRALKSN